MAKVNHYAKTIHLADDLLAKFAHTIMCGFPTATVADVVVAIMAECDIHHSPVGKVLDVIYVALKGKPILNAKHDGLQSSTLVGPQLPWSAGKGKILTVFSHYILYLVEDKVGIFLGPFTSKRTF